jgi:pyruvate/2-oxoglutarate dehydrogenase complex dihydrolipoamide dehydrogenase (E3) component
MSDHHLIVIGAGATGLAAARSARRAGRRVALVEKARPGGDCTHYGCVPSKTLLDVAHRVAGARAAEQWGLESVGDVQFGKVLAHVHDVIAQIEQDESPTQLAAEGIDLIDGWARFTSARSIDVDGRALTADRFVLATGAHAAIPPIPGLDQVNYLDNKTLFTMNEKPEHLLVMGGGAIGVELAQAFSQLGSRVTVIEAAPRILTKEEPEVSNVMTTVLERSGVQVLAGAAVLKVSGGPTLHLSDGQTITGSHLLVAVGRKPATDGMDLDRAGVEVGKQKQIVTDDYLRTTSPQIWAAGDCTTKFQFTHVGDEQGRLAASNAFATSRLLPGVAGGATKFDDSVIPWVTFTDPEIGRVGLTEQEAFEMYGERARVAVVTLDEMDRPRTAGHSDGYIKLIAGPRKLARSHVLDRIVGFTAVTPSGGELAAQVALAMRTNMLAARVARTIAPYPTYALGLRLAAARLFGEFGGVSWRPARPNPAP